MIIYHKTKEEMEIEGLRKIVNYWQKEAGIWQGLFLFASCLCIVLIVVLVS
jgi:hypothetical protein